MHKTKIFIIILFLCIGFIISPNFINHANATLTLTIIDDMTLNCGGEISNTRILKVNTDLYAVFNIYETNKIYCQTFRVGENNGTIYDQLVDFETIIGATTTQFDVVHLTGDIFFLIHNYDGDLTAQSIKIGQGNGTIYEPSWMITAVDGAGGNYPHIVYRGSNYFLATFRHDDNTGHILSFQVDEITGAWLGAGEDYLFAGANGIGKIFELSSSYYALTYQLTIGAGNYDIYIKTLNINSTGHVISAIDTVRIQNGSYNTNYDIIEIYDNTYLFSFDIWNRTGAIRTIYIDDYGNFQNFLDYFEYNEPNTDYIHAFIYNASQELFGIAYQITGGAGYLQIFNINPNGIIISNSSEYEFESGAVHDFYCLSLNTEYSYFVLGLSSAGNGYIYTFGWMSYSIYYPHSMLFVNCYDFDTGINITFDFLATNDQGNIYFDYSLDNTFIIPILSLPNGTIEIKISALNYYPRTYTLITNGEYFYINDTWYYGIVTIDAYLQNISGDIQLCTFNVVGPQTEYGADPPIEAAYCILREYINITGNYQITSTFYTNPNGQYSLYLMTNVTYNINISKAGYDDYMDTFVHYPSVTSYTFRLTPSTIVSPPGYDLFSTNITFTCAMLDGGGYNQPGNITIYYNDINLSTVDTDIYLYSYYKDVLTQINFTHNTSNTISMWMSGINTTQTHVVILYYNNTATFNDMNSPYIVYLNPINIWSERTKFDINERINNVIGPMVINGNAISWINVLAIIPALLMLVLLGPFHTGIAIISCGLVLGLTDVLFSLWFTNSFPALLLTACPIIVVVGVLYIMSKQGGDLL